MTDIDQYKFIHFPSPQPIGPLIHGSLLGKLDPNITSLPTAVDLRTRTPFEPYDQGGIGSCTANAVAGAIQFLDPSFVPSRLYLYYYARAIRGNTDVDSGSAITDNVAVANTRGAPSEKVYPYITSQFAVHPSSEADADAALHQGVEREALYNSPSSLKGALAAGYPVPIGFNVYESFLGSQSMTTGVAPMPDPTKERYLGNHCVALWGYNDDKQWYIIRNSWGPNRGDHGYFYMSYAQMHNPQLSWDPWVIRKMSTPAPPPVPIAHVAPSLDILPKQVTVGPGTYTYTMAIKNNDSVLANILLEKTVPPALSGSVSETNYVLGPSASAQVTLTVTVPMNTPVGNYEIGMVATDLASKLSAKDTFTVTVPVPVVHKVPILSFAMKEVSVPGSGTYVYNLTIGNEDSTNSVISLSRAVPYPWASNFSANNHLLTPGETRTATLTITVPANVAPGRYPIRIAGRNVDSNLKTETGFDLIVGNLATSDVILLTSNVNNGDAAQNYTSTLDYLTVLKKRLPNSKLFLLEMSSLTTTQRSGLGAVATVLEPTSSVASTLSTRLGPARAEDYLVYRALLYLATRNITFTNVSRITGTYLPGTNWDTREVLTIAASSVPSWMDSTLDKLLTV
jgi:hypothetical protein